LSISEEQVVAIPSVQMASLTAMATPASLPTGFPFAIFWSICFAFFRAFCSMRVT
jgi:hypothetical protein